MHADAQPQHHWLHRLVGSWTFTLVSGHNITPDETGGGGTEVVRSIGGLWVVADGQATMPGMGPYSSVATLGFNPATGRFVGTYIGSFMTHLWVYDGALDEAGRTAHARQRGPEHGRPWSGPAGQVRRLHLRSPDKSGAYDLSP